MDDSTVKGSTVTSKWRVKVEWVTESPFAHQCEAKVLEELYEHEPVFWYHTSHVEEFCFHRHVSAYAFALKIEAYYLENPLAGHGGFELANSWFPVVAVEEFRD